MWWTDRAGRARLVLRLAALAGAVQLAACAGAAPPQAASAYHKGPTPLDDFRPMLVQAPDQAALAVHPSGLSEAQRLALQGLVQRWQEAGGDLTVKAPAGVGDAGAVAIFSAAVSAHLQALGVPVDRIHTESYAAADVRAPLLVSFTATVAKGPDCSFGWENLAATKTNATFNHFGCASASNTAAMIAYPSDLQGATALAPSDASRREIALGHYREGKVTASDHDDQASGLVAKAVR